MNHTDAAPGTLCKDRDGRSGGFAPSKRSPFSELPSCAVRQRARAAGFSLCGAYGLLLSHDDTRSFGCRQPSRWDWGLGPSAMVPALDGGARGAFCAFGTRIMPLRGSYGTWDSLRPACFRCAEDMAPGWRPNLEVPLRVLVSLW